MYIGTTLELDRKIRELCNKSEKHASIKAKLSQGHMVAMDASYNLTCLTAFYRDFNRRQTLSITLNILSNTKLETHFVLKIDCITTL